VKKVATILCMEISHSNTLKSRYHLRFEKWWEESQNGSSLDDRHREVNVEIHVIGISTCPIIIEDFMNKAKTDIKELQQRYNC